MSKFGHSPANQGIIDKASASPKHEIVVQSDILWSERIRGLQYSNDDLEVSSAGPKEEKDFMFVFPAKGFSSRCYFCVWIERRQLYLIYPTTTSSTIQFAGLHWHIYFHFWCLSGRHESSFLQITKNTNEQNFFCSDQNSSFLHSNLGTHLGSSQLHQIMLQSNHIFRPPEVDFVPFFWGPTVQHKH